MPYINNKGINIHYKVEGNGDPLVLMHGFAGSLYDWYNFGYVEALKDKYTLIIIDGRGHGSSDKPYSTEDYDMKYRASDVIAVVNDLNIDKFHYLGYSTGATIGFSLLENYSHRLNSIILGGDHPYKSEDGIKYMLTMFSYSFDIFVKTLEKSYGKLPGNTKELLLNNDRKALLTAIPQAWPGFTHILPNVTTPTMFYIGEKDEGIKAKLTKALDQIPKYNINTIPDTDHWETYIKSELIIPHILNFHQRL